MKTLTILLLFMFFSACTIKMRPQVDPMTYDAIKEAKQKQEARRTILWLVVFPMMLGIALTVK